MKLRGNKQLLLTSSLTQTTDWTALCTSGEGECPHFFGQSKNVSLKPWAPQLDLPSGNFASNCTCLRFSASLAKNFSTQSVLVSLWAQIICYRTTYRHERKWQEEKQRQISDDGYNNTWHFWLTSFLLPKFRTYANIEYDTCLLCSTSAKCVARSFLLVILSIQSTELFMVTSSAGLVIAEISKTESHHRCWTELLTLNEQ